LKSIIQVSTGDLLSIHNLKSCIELCSTEHEIARYVVGLNFKSISTNNLDNTRKKRREVIIVQLHFSESADWNDILTGYIHAMKIRAELNMNTLQQAELNMNTLQQAELNMNTLQQAELNMNTLQLHPEVSTTENWQESMIKRTRMWTLDNAPMIIRNLDEKGWWVGTPLIDVSPELRIIINKE
jgi:hypothetical protein